MPTRGRFIKGERGGNLLVVDGHIYVVDKVRAAKTYWRCQTKTCRAPVHSDGLGLITSIVPAHNHPEKDELIRAREAIDEMHRRMLANPTRPSRAVYDEVILTVGRALRRFVPTFSSVRSSLNRTKRRGMPHIPATPGQVHIVGQWSQTLDGERFCTKVDRDFGFAAFGSSEALVALGESSKWFIDGTFRTVPKPYDQFLTIHGFYVDRVVPLIKVLMADRRVASYRAVFRHIKRKYMREVGRNITDPDIVIVDFEPALKNAVESEFNTNVKACYFHFCQSLWRRLQACGLKNAYRDEEDLRFHIRKIMAIGFLPVNVVWNNFNLLVTSQAARDLVRRHPRLQEWLTYVEHNYIRGPPQMLPAARQPLYPVVMWNVWDRDMSERTNNVVESWNKRWNAHVGVKHPGLWTFIMKLKEEEARVILEIDRADLGDAAPLRKRKWRRLERRILDLKERRRRGVVDVDRYWRAVTHLISDFI